MKVTQQVSVAMAIGSATAWVLPLPFTTINLPNVPGLPFPYPGQTSTTSSSSKKATATTTSAAGTTSVGKGSSSSFGSVKPSSFVSVGSSFASTSKSSSVGSSAGSSSVITTSASISRPTGAPSSPAGSSSSSKSSPVGSVPAGSSSSKATGSVTIPIVNPSSATGSVSIPVVTPVPLPSPSGSPSFPAGSSSKPSGGVSSPVASPSASKPVASGSSPVASPSKPVGSPSSPIASPSKPVGSSGSSPVASPSQKPSVPASGPYLPPGQTGTLQSPTCISGATSASKVPSGKPSSVQPSSASKVPTGSPSSASGKPSSASKIPSGKPSSVKTSSKSKISATPKSSGTASKPQSSPVKPGKTTKSVASSPSKAQSSPVKSDKTTKSVTPVSSPKVSTKAPKPSTIISSPSKSPKPSTAVSSPSKGSTKAPKPSTAVSSISSKAPKPPTAVSSPSKPVTTKKATSSAVKPSGSVSKPPKVSSKASSTKKASSIASSIKPKPTSSPSTIIDTTSGRLQCGTASNVTGVTQCLGIPFAQPPVGDLRFAAPVAYTGSATRDATKYGNDCAANLQVVPEALGPRLYGLLGSLGQVGDTLSEDCLFLNVWMKSQQTTEKKPVLVWIYGGGFEFGGSAVDVYSGKYFAQDEDVVFVSLNYRVNVLGFSGAPGVEQNVGLLDQRLAIEWVRDNIAAFGGDPDRITIFGQSAGGASVDYYRYAWTADPIVAGTIPHSGTVFSFAQRTPDQAAPNWYNITGSVGCGNSSTSTDTEIIACMRSDKVTTDAIIKAVTAASPTGVGSLLGSFGPVIDEKVIFSNYTDRAAAGDTIKKPVLIGNCNYEAGLFILIAAGAGQSYPQSFWDYVNTQVFTCPASKEATFAGLDAPTWRYYYSGMYPNELIPTANISQAWHTAELPVLFGTTEEIERNAGATIAESANTQPQTDLGNYMRHAWVTFASDPVNGLAGSEFAWPLYSASGDNVVYLGQNNETVAFGPASEINGPCGS